ncbi:MAG: Fic family protein [Labilithrix sp.]|nr:Fic family protein [Labilithrix sp.]MCW5812040.1 Fic family protein [Labilithrix sp.]
MSLRQESFGHVAPAWETLGDFMRRFREAYSLRRMTPMEQVIAAAASHHRLAWIHPFLDGNGRVVRLFTHAWLKRLLLDGHGLWSISRGLARRRSEYFRYLQEADEPRRGALDGRGALTDAGSRSRDVSCRRRRATCCARCSSAVRSPAEKRRASRGNRSGPRGPSWQRC